MKTCNLIRTPHKIFYFHSFTFHLPNLSIGHTLEKRFQSFIRSFLIDETFPINIRLTKRIRQKPDLSRVSSYRIASIRQSACGLFWPHDSRLKQKRAYHAAISPPRPCASCRHRSWHADCLISDSHRAARRGTRSRTAACSSISVSGKRR